MSESWKKISPNDLKQLLEKLESPWWIAGGYGIDLWLGQNTREHGDIDITLFRENFEKLFFLSSKFEFYIANKDGLRKLNLISDLKTNDWNIWVKNTGEQEWLFQCLISDEKFGKWIYRRNININRDKKLFGLTLENGNNVIAPEIQLLFKSRTLEEKDEADFKKCLKYLNNDQKIWLRESLLITSPDHPWINQL